MANQVSNYQLIQKIAADTYLTLHPETDASIVLLASSKLTQTDVKSALEALYDSVKEITDGGVVTGVKGGAETTYRRGEVNITKANIGLGNVTDDAQVKRTEMGVANGVATLDGTGKIPAAQLPSYVDDVLEFPDRAAFPAEGESGKIYVALDTNICYRWGGTTYVEISSSLALGETADTAYAGNKGKANADAIAALEDGTVAAGKADKLSTARDIALTGDITGTTSFDGSDNVSITTTLSPGVVDTAEIVDGAVTAEKLAEGAIGVDALPDSGVTAGSYSAVTVNSKGMVTAGGNIIEVGATTDATASAALAIGGIFFKKLS